MVYSPVPRRSIGRTQPTEHTPLIRRIYKRLVTLLDMTSIHCPRGKNYVDERRQEEGIAKSDFEAIQKMLIEDMWETYLEWLTLRTEMTQLLEVIEEEVDCFDR